MDEKKEEGLFQVRSYLKCLSEGFKLPTRHILSLLRFLWPSLLVGALSAGLWGVFFNQLAVVLAGWISATEPVTLLLPAYTLWGLSILSLLADSFCLGNVMVAISRYAEAGTWPGMLRFGACKSDILQASLRALVFLLAGLLVFVLWMTPFYLWLGAHSVWTLIAGVSCVLLLGVPYSMAGVDYLLGGRQGFVHSLTRMKEGYQYWGALFIVWFCGGLIMAVFSWVSWLPAAVLSFAGYESLMGTMAGDATDLPGMVSVFTVVFFMLASLITYVSGWLTLFPLSYVYGSVEARKKDLERFEAEERELQKL